MKRVAETTIGASPPAARYAYRYDDLGRRTDVTQTGELFDRFGPGLITRWDYSTKSELTKAHSGVGNDPAQGITGLPGREFSYYYDHAGNRTAALQDDHMPNGYSPDKLNQYDSRGVTRSIAVTGFADEREPSTPTDKEIVVLVNGEVAERAGEYFHSRVTAPDNSTAAQEADVRILASKEQSDVLTEEERAVFVAEDPEAFTYDADGNLKTDGLWTYDYDGENRLTAMTMMATLPGSMTRKRLEFAYDSPGGWRKRSSTTGTGPAEPRSPTWSMSTTVST